MFWMSCRVPILLTCLWCTVNGAVSISPKNEFPMKGESFTLTCTNTNPSNNINWGLEYAGSSSVLTTCIASTDNTCLPIRTGYTFTSDVSNNTFNMQIDSVSLSNCGIYTCNDATTFDSDPLTVNISDINTAKSSLNLSEPVEKTDGQVSVETDCLTPMSAISSQRCTYYTKEGVEYETCENVTPTSSSTGCTDTCNGEAWAKVTVQYQYTQATKNRVEGNLRVRIKHTGDSNHPREIVWNSTNIQWVEGPKDCKCDCCIHKIVWIVVSTLFSLPSLGWTLFVLKDARRKKWLNDNLGEQAHLCMIGWVVLNLVYSIIAAILFCVLVCKNDCCEEECDCICNCWPVYIIIGYVVKPGDVIVIVIGVVAFINGCRCCAPCCSWCCGLCTAACFCCDRCRCCAPCCSWCCGLCTAACFCCDSDEDDDENPQHGMSNKKRGRTAAASNTVPMSKAHVHATKEPKDAKHKEAMDSHSSGSAVSRNDIYPHLNETASEKPLRQQPLPPVGGQKGHGRGLSANFGDNNDTMPAVDTKRLPPVMDRNEDTEVKKKKKKKKKNKEKREQD
ncbi:uncharacterized protein LOC128234283 [Mya arenaria]|uniref:uncharacterized protein LOC128234283 n=1 Tax=Mya arenaria TaxID=6604 RepID=UPI0022DEE45F|nr:uncharacterized protein LOC128234283 [Mya arenaria]